MVGSAIARDSLATSTLTLTEAVGSESALQRCAAHGIKCRKSGRPRAYGDLFANCWMPADLVVGGVTASMGDEVMRQEILAGKSGCTSIFSPKIPFNLDELAREHGVSNVVKAAFAPGLGNVLLGRMHQNWTASTPSLCLWVACRRCDAKPRRVTYGCVFAIEVIEEVHPPGVVYRARALVGATALTMWKK
jgi:hypothetical protein